MVYLTTSFSSFFLPVFAFIGAPLPLNRASKKYVSKSVSLAHGCGKGATRSKGVQLLGTCREQLAEFVSSMRNFIE